MIYKKLLKPLLFKTDAEKAHEWALSIASKTNSSPLLQTLAASLYNETNTKLEQELFGLTFPNPIGLAAGFDKNGTTPRAMQALGFGFVEVGSITAQPSDGNPRPRAFRLPKDHSLINRMGLNNEGADAIIERLSSVNLDIPLGVNIAKTNDASIHGDAALQDYLYSYEKAQPVADYITINISCPNTGEGKTFEDPAALRDLLAALEPGKEGRKPSLVKFTVDIKRESLENLVGICEDFGVAGYVATNTSSVRDQLATGEDVLNRIGNGGLSGRAIQQRSTQIVQWLAEIIQNEKPIIGVGGIDSPRAAIEKIEAGASLIQIYTGLVYEGPGLVKRIKRQL
ncbi:MAG: quinone-dependent dihydroorotate dehydrogenase [Gracilimonas sp.]|uniref:quinone-dependent dihydroorotate dehydrogenase n=1 Tax=Gracilimonas TaxID=649462 RepID=UPI001B202E09|nr:quinone-dependent dihydroorotate dehydrogenase [Gracilimonas sp.]MBO6585835.1 quinone-dependent dihydroorotate dehydrogenase [Gracilimonas sp.]MBO6616832.1 quinone-dependent dihydroorotate dehydrogenase [Gracilimonas sp.]